MHKSFEILLINISTVRLSDGSRSVMPLDDCFIMQKIHCFHRAHARLHKHEQKDRTKTSAEFPDHVSIDYAVCKNRARYKTILELMVLHFLFR